MAESKASSRIQDDAHESAGMAHDILNAATDMAAQARDKVLEYGQEGYKLAAKKTKQFKNTTEGYIQDNPWYAIGIAAGVGLLLGMYIKSRRD